MQKPNTISCFWDWIDCRNVVSRIVLGITVWMTWRAFLWAGDFAQMSLNHPSPSSGLEASTMIAAVTAPIAALQGYIFKVYADVRTKDKASAKEEAE